jgi:hypothetical protein
MCFYRGSYAVWQRTEVKEWIKATILVGHKVLVPDRRNFPRGIEIAGYRGYQKIPTGYWTKLKSKI